MENKLNNLRARMNDTIFQDISFNEIHQQKVLNVIKNSKFKKKKFIFKERFNTVLSLAVTTCLFLGIAYYVGAKTHLFNGGQVRQGSQPSDNGKIYIPPKQEENYKEMTKEEIVAKMTHTQNNYETAKGEFKVPTGFSPGYEVVDFEVSLNHNAGVYEKITNTTRHEYDRVYIKGLSTWSINDKLGTYWEDKNYVQNPDGTPKTGTTDLYANARNLPGKFLANTQYAVNYTKELKNWEIEKQNEMFVGHNTVVIKGKVNGYHANSFRFWVDKDTGILLKYEIYDANGKIIEFLETTKLEINVPIDGKKFVPDLKGYKKEVRNQGPDIRSINSDKDIPDELKGQWDQAKKNPNETTALHVNNNWYVYIKKGYSFDTLDVKGKEGVLYLAKLSPENSQSNIQIIIERSNIDQLKIINE